MSRRRAISASAKGRSERAEGRSGSEIAASTAGQTDREEMEETRVEEAFTENTIYLKRNRRFKLPLTAFKKCHAREVTIPVLVLVPLILILSVSFLLTVRARGSSRGSSSPGGECHIPEIVLPDPCEDDWIWYKRKCYYFSKEIDEWETSQEICASKNATLAVVESKQEMEFIIRYKGSPDHWIGLKRENMTQPWVWTNGSVFNNTFQILGVSDCVLVNSGRISSASCYSDKHWICNKPDAFSLNPHF